MQVFADDLLEVSDTAHVSNECMSLKELPVNLVPLVPFGSIPTGVRSVGQRVRRGGKGLHSSTFR